MQKSFILTCLFVLLLMVQASASALSARPGFRKSIVFGYGVMNAGQTQTVHLADTPSPGLDNRYTAASRQGDAILYGLAIEKEFALSFKNTITAAGVELDYLHNKSVAGTVHPMYNVSPSFDVLKYSYNIDSLLLQATARFAREKLIADFGGYVQAGLGATINRFSAYQEYAPATSTAAPMLYPFAANDTMAPAFSAGMGIDYAVEKYGTTISLGYRFFYAGRGMLLRSPAQQTNNAITLSPLCYQFLVLSFAI